MAAEGERHDRKDPQLLSQTATGQFLELPNHLRQTGSSSSLAATSDSASRHEGSDLDDFNSTNLSQDPEDSGLAFIERCVGDAAFAPIHFQELLTENLEEIFPSSPSPAAGEVKETLLKPPTSPLLTKPGEKQRTPLEKYMLWGRLSSPFLVFLFIGVVLIVLARSHLSQLLDLLEHLPWFESTVIFVFLFTLISFPFGIGYIVLNMVAGYLYGFVRGQLVVMTSVTIGITVSFFFCRIWFHEYAQRIVTSNAMQAIMRVVEGKNGLKVIVLTRLTPIPFGLQNVLFSMTSISYWRFLVGSSLGLIPTQCINTYMGSTVRNMQEVLGSKVDGYIILIAQVLFSVVLMVYVFRKARKELTKLTQVAQDSRDRPSSTKESIA